MSMSAEILIVRCVCERGHTLCSVEMAGERIMSAEELVQRMRDSIAEGRFGTECTRCGARRETWRLEAEERPPGQVFSGSPVGDMKTGGTWKL
jgi:hypothetical protein